MYFYSFLSHLYVHLQWKKKANIVYILVYPNLLKHSRHQQSFSLVAGAGAGVVSLKKRFRKYFKVSYTQWHLVILGTATVAGPGLENNMSVSRVAA